MIEKEDAVRNLIYRVKLMRKTSQGLRELKGEWLAKDPTNDSAAKMAETLSNFLDDVSDEIEACFKNTTSDK